MLFLYQKQIRTFVHCGSHSVLCGQPLFEGEGELVRELGPGLVPHPGLEPMKDLVEHVFELGVRVLPGGDGVAKVNEVVHHASGVDGNHVTHAPESRVLFVIVPDVPETCAPRPHKLV